MAAIIRLGIGLLLWSPDVLIDVFGARHNTFKAGKDKKIRESVLESLNKRDKLNGG
jgi:hypothetical protein